MTPVLVSPQRYGICSQNPHSFLMSPQNGMGYVAKPHTFFGFGPDTARVRRHNSPPPTFWDVVQPKQGICSHIAHCFWVWP